MVSYWTCLYKACSSITPLQHKHTCSSVPVKVSFWNHQQTVVYQAGNMSSVMPNDIPLIDSMNMGTARSHMQGTGRLKYHNISKTGERDVTRGTTWIRLFRRSFPLHNLSQTFKDFIKRLINSLATGNIFRMNKSLHIIECNQHDLHTRSRLTCLFQCWQ